MVSIKIPVDGDAKRRINGGERQVMVERMDDANNVRVIVAGLVKMDIKVTSFAQFITVNNV